MEIVRETIASSSRVLKDKAMAGSIFPRRRRVRQRVGIMAASLSLRRTSAQTERGRKFFRPPIELPGPNLASLSFVNLSTWWKRWSFLITQLKMVGICARGR